MNLSALKIGSAASIVAGFAVCTALLAYGVTEEVAIGSLQGRVLMSSTRAPLENATVVLRPTSWIPEDAARTRTAKSDKQGRFVVRNLVAGSYVIEAFSRAHQLTQTPIEVVEGSAATVDLELKPRLSELTLNMSQHVFAPDESAEFQMRGYSGDPSIEIDLYRIKFESVIRKGSLQSLLQPVATTWGERVDPDNSSDFQKLQPSYWPIQNRDGEGVFDERVTLPRLAEGLYWMRLRTREASAGTWLAVSKIGLVTKIGDSKLLAYVADLRTGKPVEGATISSPIGGEAKSTMSPVGTTGADGTLTLGNTNKGGGKLLIASSGNSYAICSYYSGDHQSASSKIWCYTDRPVYRPGDTAFFKGIARQLRGADYSVPPPTSATVELRDPNNNIIESQTVSTNSIGTFAGKVKLDPDTVGNYALSVRIGDSKDTFPIVVLSYRKPEFKISVTPEKPFYTQKETIRMRVKCEYYFGGPVPGAKLQATLSSAPMWEPWGLDSEETDYDDAYGDWSGDYVDQLETVTNSDGIAVFEYKPKPNSENTNQWFGLDSQYTFSVSGSESGDKYFEGTGKVRVVQGDYSLSGEFSSYFVAPGTPVRLEIVAKNQDGSAAADRVVDFQAGYETWERNRVNFVASSNRQATTNAEGRTTVEFNPDKNGSFVVRCKSVDKSGNEIRQEFNVWVWDGAGGGDFGPAPKLQIVLDKPLYSPGQNAVAIIRTDKAGGDALVTVETADVVWKRVVPLTNEVVKLQIPVSSTYAPNAFVSASLIRDKKFSTATRRLGVDLSAKRLKVEITPSANVFEPRQEATYRIKTMREDGTPVPADVSFGVVDEAIYAIRADNADPIAEFYPKRYRTVETVYSFPELYLDGGDKDDIDANVRNEFVDTAYWNPNIQTSLDGTATVTVKLKDNLTSWRATAIAVGPNSTFGKSTANITVRKKLMARLSLPSQMVLGDVVTISAAVHNDSGSDGSVSIDLQATNLEIEGKTSQTINIANGTKADVLWKVKATGVGRTEVTLRAQMAGGLNDGVRLTIPIYAHGRESVEYQAGAFIGAKDLEVVRIDKAEQGRARLQISPSLAGGILAALDDLVDYPYGCTEQTMSRFMPAVVVAKTLRDLNISRPDILSRLPRVVRQSLAKLSSYQHYDGGWGWWENDDSSPEMTAIVLEGLARAKIAGQSIDEEMIKRGVTWSERWLKSNHNTSARETAVHLSYAVLLNQQSAIAVEALASIDQTALGAEGLALYALAARTIGPELQNSTVSGKAKSASTRLINASEQQGEVIHWKDEWNLSGTARALQAMVALNPADPRIPKVIRYLMDSRRGSSWYSTADTAQILVGLTGYLRYTKELESTYQVQVIVNGDLRETIQVTPQSAVTRIAPIDLPISMLPDRSVIRLVSSGTSPCYYSIETKQTPNESSIGALVNGSGMEIHRSYHRLVAQKLEDGTSRLSVDPNEIREFQSGDNLRCVVTLNFAKPASYVMIEVPAPSNMRVSENASPENWNWWWSSMSVFDNRVVLFASNVPSGKQVLEFNIKAEAPGTCAALPALAYEMYRPEMKCASAAEQIVVNP